VKKIVYFDKEISDETFKLAVREKNIVKGIRKHNDFVDGIIDAFEKQGYEVVLNYRTSYFFYQKIFRTNDLLRLFRKSYNVIFRRFDQYFLNKVLQNDVENSNASIYFTELNHAISSKSLEIFRKKGIRTIEWFGLFPFQFKKDDNVLKSAPYFDLILSCCDILPLFKDEHKPRRFLELFPAYNPKTVKNIELLDSEIDKYGYDVVFIGSVAKIHSNRWDILELLANTYDNFVFFGYGVEQVPAQYTFLNKYKGAIWTEEYVKVINGSKIILNLFLDDYKKVKSGVNLRTFEIPACQAFELSQHVPGIEKYFEIGKDVETFKDNNELIEKIDYFLENDKEREMIAKSGYKKVVKFTFENQIKYILGCI
jgi:spore maturation protein CgeB